VKSMLSTLQPIYLPQISKIPLNKGLSWVPTWKGLPNDDKLFDKRGQPNAFSSLKYEIASFARDVNLIHSREGTSEVKTSE
jgi:hypothetical protein